VEAPVGAAGFAARLAAALARQGRGYTNRRFFDALMARLAGTGVTYRGSKVVTEWTKGRAEPPLAVVESIAAVLGVTPSWLAFGYDGKAPPRPADLSAAPIQPEDRPRPEGRADAAPRTEQPT